MVDSMKYKDWIEKSKSDYNAAKTLKENDCGNDIVAFHCQQSIEKCFKGYLLKNLGQIIQGHSLIYLCQQSIKINDSFKGYLKDCAFINQYYIETRYPSDTPLIVSNEDADECLKITNKIIDSIIKLLY